MINSGDNRSEMGQTNDLFENNLSEFFRDDFLKNAGVDTDILSADVESDHKIQSPSVLAEEGENALSSHTFGGSDSGSAMDNSITVAEGDSFITNQIETVDVQDQLVGYSDREIDVIEQLEMALPGLPFRRIVKIRNVFHTTLGAPSVLQLIPLLRETMPDNLDVPRLVKMNGDNAEFALQKAIETNSVNRQLLDAMLQVKSKSGSLDGAIEFYEEPYRELNTVRRNHHGLYFPWRIWSFV